MLKRVIVFGGLCILIGLIVMQNIDAHSTSADGSKTPAQAILNGQAAPFTLQGLDGQSYGIAAGDARDKPLMINFWASWCGPCAAEAPELKLLYDKYKGKFDLYSINATSMDYLGSVKDFVKQYGLPFPILLDKAGTAQKLYRVTFTPTSFLIDRSGKIVDVFNVVDDKLLESKIQKLID